MDRIGRPYHGAHTYRAQIINTVQAQVASGNILNYHSYNDLLDKLEGALAQLDDVDDDARAEARGILDKLRSASGKIATGTVASSGGAVIGAPLQQLLNLH